jgi:hypothetical protein
VRKIDAFSRGSGKVIVALTERQIPHEELGQTLA